MGALLVEMVPLTVDVPIWLKAPLKEALIPVAVKVPVRFKGPPLRVEKFPLKEILGEEIVMPAASLVASPKAKVAVPVPEFSVKALAVMALLAVTLRAPLIVISPRGFKPPTVCWKTTFCPAQELIVRFHAPFPSASKA